ncbi:MAG: hypothetical protein GY865_01560 [candidate division Zixibacteria bacterium]|nr:hypothetical protein [candidate division Zixibacteria bacterium]
MGNNIKPGYKTTEFWVTVGIQIVGLLVLLGVLSPESAKSLQVDIPAIGAMVSGLITDIMALGAMVLTVYRYITGRSAVKKEAESA